MYSMFAGSATRKRNAHSTTSNEEFLPIQQHFQYTGIEKYISLTQTIKVAPDEEIINQTFILDQQLSIIFNYKSPNKFKFESFRTISRQVEENDIVYMLQDEKRDILYEKWYEWYPHLYDFLIGREYWGRTQNCMKISCDQISRDHSRILYNGLKRQKQKTELQQVLRSIINNEARVSSKMKQIPQSLWENILNYALSKSRYTVKDCESRNCTYVLDYSKIEWCLTEKGDYSFQNEEYSIQVDKIMTGSETDILQVIQRFRDTLQANFNPNHLLKIIYPYERNQNGNLNEVIHALHFHIDIKSKYRFHFWIMNSGVTATYFIGQGQQLSISYNQSYEISRHGKIVFRQGKWYIGPINENERIWFKLTPHVQYELKVCNKYKVRFAHLNALDIEFFNYSN